MDDFRTYMLPISPASCRGTSGTRSRRNASRTSWHPRFSPLADGQTGQTPGHRHSCLCITSAVVKVAQTFLSVRYLPGSIVDTVFPWERQALCLGVARRAETDLLGYIHSLILHFKTESLPLRVAQFLIAGMIMSSGMRHPDASGKRRRTANLTVHISTLTTIGHHSIGS